MKFFSNLLKKIKDKIGFRIMTKEEYELFLRKKSMGQKPSSFKTNHNKINPASGLPMVGGVDVQGNPYGTSFNSSSSYHND
jgi:hypothetical protein